MVWTAAQQVLAKSALGAAAKADFRSHQGDKSVVSHLPPTRARPLGQSPFLSRRGADEVFGATRDG
jgi:hypothetical protein